MKHTVYIDGQAGTTGLQLRHKLERHDAVELLLISEEKRKDEAERKRLMNSAEVVFLCLPDEAARAGTAGKGFAVVADEVSNLVVCPGAGPDERLQRWAVCAGGYPLPFPACPDSVQ